MLHKKGGNKRRIRPIRGSTPIRAGKSGVKRDNLLHRRIMELRESSEYENYSSNLKSLTRSLGLNVVNEIQTLGHQNVLDLGCGKAVALEELHGICPNVKCHGLTFVEEPEFKALRQSGVDIKTGNWKSLHDIYGPGSMDFIYWNYGLDHSVAVSRDIFQISRVLKKGGKLLFNLAASDTRLLREVIPALRKANLRIIRKIPTEYVGAKHNVSHLGEVILMNSGGVTEGIAFYVEKAA